MIHNQLWTASKDCYMKCLEISTPTLKYKVKHSTPISKVKVIDSNRIMTGNDDGIIHMWDTRDIHKPYHEYTEAQDYISDICIDFVSKNRILVTSGDGYLIVIDPRKTKESLDKTLIKKPQLDPEEATNVIARSDQFESDLLNLTTLKNGQKVVVGDGEGVLNLFNYDYWG